MNFEFSDEQMAMKDEVRKLLDKENSLKRNRTILEGEDKFDKELWDSLVAMGLPLSLFQKNLEVLAWVI